MKDRSRGPLVRNVRRGRLDPTRTLALRRWMENRIRVRYARLRGEIVHLVVTEKSFVSNYSPDEERDDRGRWVAAGMAAVHLEHSITQYAKDAIEDTVTRLPHELQSVVRAVYHAGKAVSDAMFVNHAASQAFAERVAVERGLSADQAKTLRGSLAAVDSKTFEVAKVGAIIGVLGHAPAMAAWAVPVASASYLAYSTAKDPLATLRAAQKVVKEARHVEYTGSTAERRSSFRPEVAAINANPNHDERGRFSSSLEVGMVYRHNISGGDDDEGGEAVYMGPRVGDTRAVPQHKVMFVDDKIFDVDNIDPEDLDLTHPPREMTVKEREMFDDRMQTHREMLGRTNRTENAEIGILEMVDRYLAAHGYSDKFHAVFAVALDEGLSVVDSLNLAAQPLANAEDQPRDEHGRWTSGGAQSESGQNYKETMTHSSGLEVRFSAVLDSDPEYSKYGWETRFSTVMPGGKPTLELTGTQGAMALPIMRQALAALDRYLDSQKPDRVWFTAIEPSRIRLYNKVAPRIAERNGYNLKIEGRMEGMHYFLSKKSGVENAYRQPFLEEFDSVVGNAEEVVANEAWHVHSDADKVSEFQDWLKSRDPLATDEDVWARYIEQGYRKGAGRAFDDVNRPALHLDKVDFYNGSREEFLRGISGRVSEERLKFLAGRSFAELRGVSADMSTKLSRALADGLVRGAGPREVAADLVREVGFSENRARTVARTELIRAHAEGQLDGLESLGVGEVGVKAEWSTSGLDTVCELCSDLEGTILPIAKARGMIPRHPNCACSWVPVVGVFNVGNPNHDARGRFAGAVGAGGLSAADKAVHTAAVHAVVSRIPTAAARELVENTKSVRFFGDAKSLTDKLMGKHPEAAKMLAGVTVQGCYDASAKELYMDGVKAGSVAKDVAGLYAHEMTHAIDGPTYKYSRDPAWVAAWKEEIVGKGGLTQYSKTKPNEGLAEFGRALYAGHVDSDLLEHHFPKCCQFWRERGLWA